MFDGFIGLKNREIKKINEFVHHTIFEIHFIEGGGGYILQYTPPPPLSYCVIVFVF